MCQGADASGGQVKERFRAWDAANIEPFYGSADMVVDAGLERGGITSGYRLVNRSARDAVFLVVGDRLPGDEAEYPDVDLAFRTGPGRVNRFTRKDGTPY